MTAAPSAEQQTDDPFPELIADAFDASRERPTPERLREIDKLLREEIDRLSTTAAAMAEHRTVRSRGWYALVNAVDRAEDARAFQSREGLAGALNVAELARTLVELRKVTAS